MINRGVPITSLRGFGIRGIMSLRMGHKKVSDYLVSEWNLDLFRSIYDNVGTVLASARYPGLPDVGRAGRRPSNFVLDN